MTLNMLLSDLDSVKVQLGARTSETHGALVARFRYLTDPHWVR